MAKGVRRPLSERIAAMQVQTAELLLKDVFKRFLETPYVVEETELTDAARHYAKVFGESKI